MDVVVFVCIPMSVEAEELSLALLFGSSSYNFSLRIIIGEIIDLIDGLTFTESAPSSKLRNFAISFILL